jgi:hypothetical protein
MGQRRVEIRSRGDGEEEDEKEEEGREGGRSREDKLSSSSYEHGRRGSHGLQVPCLSDPPAREKVVVHEKAQK